MSTVGKDIPDLVKLSSLFAKGFKMYKYSPDKFANCLYFCIMVRAKVITACQNVLYRFFASKTKVYKIHNRPFL